MSQTTIEVSSSKQATFIDIGLSYFHYFLDMLVNVWNWVCLYFAAQVENAEEGLNQVSQKPQAVCDVTENDIDQLVKDMGKVVNDTKLKVKAVVADLSAQSMFPPVIQPVNNSQADVAQHSPRQ